VRTGPWWVQEPEKSRLRCIYVHFETVQPGSDQCGGYIELEAKVPEESGDGEGVVGGAASGVLWPGRENGQEVVQGQDGCHVDMVN
jgi:hypothetical protein